MSEVETHGSESSAENPRAVATLRELKSAEAAGQQRLEATRAQGEAALKTAQAAREKLLSDTRREGEALRVRRIQEATAQAGTQSLIAQAQAEAAKLGNLTPQEVDARMEEVLSTVLGDLRPSSKRPSGTR